ncbi:uncharacterized protein [Primulina huaijiensis]|uniref:uncharacterized protein isoform X2 n=1 Tax=Primulina huaijiensis TaxID=1492673 RepID=UPI003CC797D4
MASLFKDQNKISAYRDRRFSGTQEEFEEVLLSSTTVYVGNMSFYTTEEQVYELFTRAGEIKKIVMGLDKNSKTPCGFCFVVYYSRDDTEDCVKYISGTILDDRPIRVDFDWGFQEGRQWGRGRSGGQLVDMVETIIRGDLTAMAEVLFSLRHRLSLSSCIKLIGCCHALKKQITLVNDTGKMTTGFQSSQREGQIMYTGEFQSMNPDLRKTHGFEKVVILMTMRMRRILRSFLRNFRQLVCEFNCLRTYISLLRYKSCGHIPIQVSLAFCNSPSQYLYRRVKVHVSHQYAKGETNSSILQYAGLLQVSSDFFGKKLL